MISLDLKAADLRAVLHRDNVLDDMLSQHGLVAQIDGKTIHVTKKKE